MSNTKKGFSVSVYTDGSDCTNGGISARHKTLMVVGKCDEFDMPQIFNFEDGDDNVMELRMRDVGFARFPIIVPLDYDEKQYMFGGNFGWTSDSRFKGSPIKIFDRYEGMAR